ncbi:MAG: hypothetical protein EXR78_07690 [Deltaproteobacteria bacterium]|nr:hypothetical protein [Deltaproteobacteria bacterium]
MILSQQLADNPDANLTEKHVQFAQTIHGAGSDLLTLINEILDLARIESGATSLNVSEVRFSDLRADLLRMFQPIAEHSQVTLTVDLDARLLRAPSPLMTPGCNRY